MRASAVGALAASAFLLLSVAGTAHAQRRRASRQSTAEQRRAASPALQAEFAAVLLQAGRYDEAAREYRALLARAPHNTSYRLNLARALAWGNHHREAEPLLRELRAELPRETEIVTLLHSARANLEPTAAEAVAWLGEESDYTPYRVALARALARERRPRLAIEQYERLLAGNTARDTTLPSTAMLRRELIDAYEAVDDRAGGIRVLRETLALATCDTLLRRELAQLLVADRQYDAALAEYDTLLLTAPSARLFADRAKLHLARNEREAARADITSSLAIAPSADAYLLLGDLQRDVGDYRAARVAYESARALDPAGTTALSASLAQLAREERPVIQLAPLVGDDPGWTSSSQSASDNLGTAFVSTELRRAERIGATVLSAGTELIMLRGRSDARATDLGGVGASVGASRQFSSGSMLARVGGEAGVVKHAGVRAIPEVSASVALWQRAWMGEVSVIRRAAYRSLFTVASLLPDDGSAPLTEQSVGGSIAGPLGTADVAISVERARISDGNARITLQAYTRYPVGTNLFAVYSGTTEQFAQRSARYWDPLMYNAHAAGLEYSARQLRGLSYAVRVLPGIAATRELRASSLRLDVGSDEAVRHNALMIGASADAGYRSRVWDIAAALSYGRGRAGDYQRLGAMLTVRRSVGRGGEN